MPKTIINYNLFCDEETAKQYMKQQELENRKRHKILQFLNKFYVKKPIQETKQEETPERLTYYDRTGN